MTLSNLRKAYADVAGGQLHYRTCGIGGVPLLCLAPAPFSGLAFANILPILAKERQVIAPDYPGYGASDPLSGIPSITDYAAALLGFAKSVCPGGPVDLLGFHSGCLVAAEMALSEPRVIRSIVLIDVPAFDQEQRRSMAARFAGEPEYSEELGTLDPLWQRAVASRHGTQPLAQRLALFADLVASGEHLNRMFNAAFAYPVEERLAALDRPVTILATQGSLNESSRRAARLMPAASFVDCSDIAGSVLDAHAQQTAAAVDAALNSA